METRTSATLAAGREVEDQDWQKNSGNDQAGATTTPWTQLKTDFLTTARAELEQSLSPGLYAARTRKADQLQKHS